MDRPNVVFILHLPPPVHGAAMMGKYIHDSKLINECINGNYINLTLAKDIQDIGKGGLRKLCDYIKQLVHIHSEVKRLKPDLCYVTPNAKGGAFYKDFVIVMMLKALGQKVVVHYHNKGVAAKQDNILDNFLYKSFFKNLKVILLAEELYPDVCKYVNRKNVYICPNGIPMQDKKTKKVAHEGFNILFLSNMMEAKGVWDLIGACKILKEKGRSLKCHFVGKWSDISEIEFKKKIHEYKLDNMVYAHGAQYGNEKNIFFEKTDLFVFPTLNEAFGLVLLEAMEYGIPCIATNEGGVPSVMDNGRTGFIVDKHSPEQLAEKIEILIDNPRLCEEMGKAGRIKFENEFTIEKFENRMKNILNEIIKC